MKPTKYIYLGRPKNKNNTEKRIVSEACELPPGACGGIPRAEEWERTHVVKKLRTEMSQSWQKPLSNKVWRSTNPKQDPFKDPTPNPSMLISQKREF